jgi:hypothetical protein
MRCRVRLGLWSRQLVDEIPDGLREYARPKAITSQRFAPPMDRPSFEHTDKTMQRLLKVVTMMHGKQRKREETRRTSSGHRSTCPRSSPEEKPAGPASPTPSDGSGIVSRGGADRYCWRRSGRPDSAGLCLRKRVADERCPRTVVDMASKAMSNSVLRHPNKQKINLHAKTFLVLLTFFE